MHIALFLHNTGWIMPIWLRTCCHRLKYFGQVKEMLPDATVYVYEDNASKNIIGFIGLNEDYIEGIFVERTMRSHGIGRQLLDYVKAIKPAMSLNVYQKNSRAVAFYQREHFVIRSESLDSATNEKDFLMVWSKLR